jgi:hypothetical protein
MALALTWLRSTSHASDAPKSASTITSQARTSFATRKNRLGEKTTVASRMEIG